ncbi:Pleckstrin like proteiny domain-containing family A member 6 [Chelonia mydas]|uniref:Pleckstrin like proteiny domain-containing family A member 6 n=1 Tax=Chelonia mydas TaxID=8469 RepID=M7B1E4_CHEMY|nr:Pleckstrin like proteiny domain-containing family A member 6 [Chelonia mydas]
MIVQELSLQSESERQAHKPFPIGSPGWGLFANSGLPSHATDFQFPPKGWQANSGGNANATSWFAVAQNSLVAGWHLICFPLQPKPVDTARSFKSHLQSSPGDSDCCHTWEDCAYCLEWRNPICSCKCGCQSLAENVLSCHNERRNTFLHPVTGHIPEENARFDLHLQNSTVDMSSKAGGKRPATISSESSNHTMVSEMPQERPNGRASRPSRKGIAFGKRSNSMKRNPSATVTKSGWLFKQASSGVKQWNKRWFVLVDRCLFYYKDEKEDSILGSIPLLSFRVAAIQPSDNISRKHTFKVTVCWVEEALGRHTQSLSPQAEHAGIRTYFFSAENTEEQESWIQAMGEAARVQIPPPQRREKTDSENIPPSKHHHHRTTAHREHPKADLEAKTRGEGDGRGSEKIERKPERIDSKKEPLVKANGIVGQEMPSEPSSPYPEAPRFPAGVERSTQPNGWQYSSPSRPGSNAYPPQDGGSRGDRQGPARPTRRRSPRGRAP